MHPCQSLSHWIVFAEMIQDVDRACNCTHSISQVAAVLAEIYKDFCCVPSELFYKISRKEESAIVHELEYTNKGAADKLFLYSTV